MLSRESSDTTVTVGSIDGSDSSWLGKYNFLGNGGDLNYKLLHSQHGNSSGEESSTDSSNRTFSERMHKFWCKWDKPRMSMVILPITFYFLAIFMTIPLGSQVLIELVCMERQKMHKNDDPIDCTSPEVSKYASIISLYASIALNIPSFMLSGFYGQVADKYGRKVALIIPSIGYAIYISILFFITWTRPSYYVILYVCASVILGLSGSFNTFQMALFTFTSDVTATKVSQRAYYFSIVEACLFGGKVIGPLIAGIWACENGFVEPLGFAVCVSIFTTIWIIIFFKESLPPSMSASYANKPLKFDPLSTLKAIYTLYSLKPADGSGTSPLPYICGSFFLFYVSLMADLSIAILYWKVKFGWDSSWIGYFQATDSTIAIISMLFLPSLMSFLRGGRPLNDIYWSISGLLGRCIFYALIPFMESNIQIFCLTIVLVLAGPLTPRTRAIVSNSVPPSLQAQTLAAFSALQSLALILSPLYTAIYSATVETDPAIVFYTFAIMCGLGLMLALQVLLNPEIKKNLPNGDGTISHFLTLTGEGGAGPGATISPSEKVVSEVTPVGGGITGNSINNNNINNNNYNNTTKSSLMRGHGVKDVDILYSSSPMEEGMWRVNSDQTEE